LPKSSLESEVFLEIDIALRESSFAAFLTTFTNWMERLVWVAAHATVSGFDGESANEYPIWEQVRRELDK
jgi:hypothetical protein